MSYWYQWFRENISIPSASSFGEDRLENLGLAASNPLPVFLLLMSEDSFLKVYTSAPIL